MWSLSAPAGHSLLLEFDHLDLEDDSNCQYDRLTVLVGTNRPVGKQLACVCARARPDSVMGETVQKNLHSLQLQVAPL